jgi:hypothetical protein
MSKRTRTSLGEKPTLLMRFTDQILDVKGNIYGDEQERLRWYEGITVAASIQWVLVPWVVAVSIWLGGRAVVSYLLAVMVAMYLPQLLTMQYAMRSRIRLDGHWSPKAMVTAILSGGSYVAIALASVRAYDGGFDPDGLKGGVVGGFLGLGLVVVFARLYSKRTAAAVERDAD